MDIVAMENWGLITVRMKDLLYNPNKNGLDNMWHTIEVIAHEISHQVTSRGW